MTPEQMSKKELIEINSIQQETINVLTDNLKEEREISRKKTEKVTDLENDVARKESAIEELKRALETRWDTLIDLEGQKQELEREITRLTVLFAEPDPVVEFVYYLVQKRHEQGF